MEEEVKKEVESMIDELIELFGCGVDESQRDVAIEYLYNYVILTKQEV